MSGSGGGIAPLKRRSWSFKSGGFGFILMVLGCAAARAQEYPTDPDHNRLSSVRARRLIGGLDFKLPCGRCQLYLCSQNGSSAARRADVS